MEIKINQISPRRENGEIISVNIHFNARTEDGSINLSGSLPLEYFTENINFTGLENEVKQELIDRIMNGEINAE